MKWAAALQRRPSDCPRLSGQPWLPAIMAPGRGVWLLSCHVHASRTGNSLGLVADEIDLSFQAASLVPADQFLLLHAAHHNAGCNAQGVGKLWNFRYRELF